MERKIISIDISPETQGAEQNENAGVMWEHNATTLVFNIAPEYIGDYRYYIEYRSLLGTKVRTEYLELNTENNTVAYNVPVTMSSLKGVECHFNIVLIDEDGNTTQVIKPHKFCLQFDYSPDTDNSLAKVNDFSINALLEAIRLNTFKGEKGDKGDKGDEGDKGEQGDGVNNLFQVGKNLFDASEYNRELGSLNLDGTEGTNTSFIRTKYIYLDEGSYVYSNEANNYEDFRLCIYNLSKELMSIQKGEGSNLFTIDGPRYVRFHDSFRRTQQQLERGTTPTEYEPYDIKLKLKHVPVDALNIPVVEDNFNAESENALSNKVITKRFNSFLRVGKNLYNNARRIDDVACSNATAQIIGAKAETQAVVGQSISDWIAVEENEIYILSHGDLNSVAYCIQIVDDNNTLVANFFQQSDNEAFETPLGAKKLRFSNIQEIMDTTQFEKGEEATDYVPYVEKIKNDNLPTAVQQNWFEDKTILFDGDGITSGTGLLTNLTYPYLVCKELNAKIINNAIGGSTLASNPESETRNPLVLRYDSDIADEVAKTVDFVYIAVGSNDWAYQYTPVGTMDDRIPTTFYGALHLLCEGLLNKYAGKPIVFATPIKRRVLKTHTSPTEYLRNGKTLKEYGEIIKEVCDFYSIPVIDMYSECGLMPFVDSQRDLYFQETNNAVRPNAEGAKVMARRAIAGLRNVVG